MKLNNHIIHNLDFAKKKLYLAVDVGLNECTRLTPLLHSPSQDSTNFMLRYTMQGIVDEFERAQLELHIATRLPMGCQRCLNLMMLELNLSYIYEISASESIDNVESDDLDWLEIDPAMNILALVEDEVIAAIPIAPMHVGECVNLKLESGDKVNPFAALKDIVKK